MKNKLFIVGVAATTVLLGACSNNVDMQNKMASLTNQVSALSTKVDGLESQHPGMMADTAAAAASARTAASEAKRANMRIDNIVDSYKK